MADIACVCNGIWDDDLRDYLSRHPTESIEELRAKERICNSRRQCELIIIEEISRTVTLRRSQS